MRKTPVFPLLMALGLSLCVLGCSKKAAAPSAEYAQARELMPHVEYLPEVTFIGHSHLCKAFAIGNGEVNDVVAQKFGIRRGYKYIISVGSVGQPRDYDNRACFVICDTDARTVEYLRVEYDIETSAQKIFDADLALNFGKRLFLGV